MQGFSYRGSESSRLNLQKFSYFSEVHAFQHCGPARINEIFQ